MIKRHRTSFILVLLTFISSPTFSVEEQVSESASSAVEMIEDSPEVISENEKQVEKAQEVEVAEEVKEAEVVENKSCYQLEKELEEKEHCIDCTHQVQSINEKLLNICQIKNVLSKSSQDICSDEEINSWQSKMAKISADLKKLKTTSFQKDLRAVLNYYERDASSLEDFFKGDGEEARFQTEEASAYLREIILNSGGRNLREKQRQVTKRFRKKMINSYLKGLTRIEVDLFGKFDDRERFKEMVKEYNEEKEEEDFEQETGLAKCREAIKKVKSLLDDDNDILVNLIKDEKWDKKNNRAELYARIALKSQEYSNVKSKKEKKVADKRIKIQLSREKYHAGVIYVGAQEGRGSIKKQRKDATKSFLEAVNLSNKIKQCEEVNCPLAFRRNAIKNCHIELQK